MICLTRIFLLCSACLISAPARAAHLQSKMVLIPAGKYPSFEKPKKGSLSTDSANLHLQVELDSFSLDQHPVTNEDFQEFVRSNPEWQKGNIKSVFADSQYLAKWPSGLRFPRNSAKQPVTSVSWFAAKAYCESKRKFLPTTDEWEYALFDNGKNSERVKQNILSWYARTASSGLKTVGTSEINGYGVSDLGVLVWEWTDDFDSFLSPIDSRDGGRDSKLFCSAGSELGDASDYATFARYSFRSSLKANYTTTNLGFRCVKDKR
jgi:sulfatase modifying factor 1